ENKTEEIEVQQPVEQAEQPPVTVEPSPTGRSADGGKERKDKSGKKEKTSIITFFGRKLEEISNGVGEMFKEEQ
ncbi:MAG: hypothetical protein LBR34_00535, partial [Prevotella sp.]|nr:hypothetical protein [Prevotella sp.]